MKKNLKCWICGKTRPVKYAYEAIAYSHFKYTCPECEKKELK